MSTYIVSDIHGNNEAFRRALKKVRLKKEDSLIVLGDMIDRGIDSKGVLDTIILLREHGFTVKCIRGNHEEMLLNSIDNITERVLWFKNGGKQTLLSFLVPSVEKIDAKYITLIQSMPYYIEEDENIFVHAALNMNSDDPFTDKKTMLWSRDWESNLNKGWLGRRRIFHGHTPLKKDKIVEKFQDKNNQIFCLDNGTHFKGKEGYGNVCILRLEDYFYHFEPVENINETSRPN